MLRLLTLSFAQLTRLVILLLGFALLVALGLDLLFATETVRSYFPGIKWLGVLNLNRPTMLDETALLALGGFMILIPLLYLGVGLVDWRLKRGITGRGRNGRNICLDSEAISRTITREIRNQAEEVISVKSCEAWQALGGPKVVIRVVISDRSPVPQVQEKVKGIAVQVMTQLIGFADGSRITVKVREIAGATLPRKVRKTRRKNGDSPNPSEELVTHP